MTDQRTEKVDFRIRPARQNRKDSEGIARAFSSTYEEYPFAAYTEPETVLEEVIPGEDSANYVIELMAGQEVGGERIDEPRIVGTGSVKLDEEGRVGELGGAVLDPAYQGIEGADMYPDLLDTRWQKAYELGADIPFTQPVSSTHAITQHEHAKRGFVPLGISRNKYPEVFKGEGRETTVPMVDSDADFQYLAGSGKPEVYVTDQTYPLVDFVQGEVNENRDGELLRRNPRMEGDRPADTGYTMKKKAEDPEVAGNASFQILPNGDMSFEEVKAELEQKKEDDRYSWVGAEVDANHPYAWDLTDRLLEEGFIPEQYFPEKLSYRHGEPRDALGFQYSEGDTGGIELINEAVEAAESAGLEIDTVPDTGRGHTKYAYL